MSNSVSSTLRSGLFTRMCSSPVLGDSQWVEMPRKDMEGVVGQMVVLEAWYTPTSAIEKNTVIWTFMANNTKQVSVFEVLYESTSDGLTSSLHNALLLVIHH